MANDVPIYAPKTQDNDESMLQQGNLCIGWRVCSRDFDGVDFNRLREPSPPGDFTSEHTSSESYRGQCYGKSFTPHPIAKRAGVQNCGAWAWRLLNEKNK